MTSLPRLVPIALIALAACADDGRAGPEAPATMDAHDDTDARPADACAPMPMPATATRYYVAIGEPGADDDACDGLAPRDEGSGRCPFRTLAAVTSRRLLEVARSVRVELDAGTYLVEGWEGLRVDGAGASEDERVVLAARPGERVVLDVPAPDGAGCTEAEAPTTPRCVRQTVLLSGAFTGVEGLIIRNGLGYHVEIRGGHDHALRCNTIGETVAFASRSDLVKVDGGASRVTITHNDLSAFRSQAIDVTGSFDVLIEGNTFHHPIDGDGGAVGIKLGARGVVVRDNTIHDVCPAGLGVVFSLGGTSADHGDDAEAFGVEVRDNHVSRSPCKVAQLVSCQGCRFEDNDVDDVGAGVLLSSAATGLPACGDRSGGCLPSRGATIRGNRFRGLHGGGDPSLTDFFVYADPGERVDLDVGENTYCVGAGGVARFALDGGIVDLATWVAATGDDSVALDATAPGCTSR